MPVITPSLGLTTYKMATDASSILIYTMNDQVSGSATTQNLGIIDSFAGNTSSSLTIISGSVVSHSASLVALSASMTMVTGSLTAISASLAAIVPILAIATRNVAQSIPSGSTMTPISFDTVYYDNGNYFDISASPTRMTLPVDGIYRMDTTIYFGANTTGIRGLKYYKNGVEDFWTPEVNAIQGGVQGTTVAYSTLTAQRNAGDYYEFFPYQNSGGSLIGIVRASVQLVTTL